MTISELIASLEEAQDRFGDIYVELGSGAAVAQVDAVYDDGDFDAKPVAVAIK